MCNSVWVNVHSLDACEAKTKQVLMCGACQSPWCNYSPNSSQSGVPEHGAGKQGAPAALRGWASRLQHSTGGRYTTNLSSKSGAGVFHPLDYILLKSQCYLGEIYVL